MGPSLLSSYSKTVSYISARYCDVTQVSSRGSLVSTSTEDADLPTHLWRVGHDFFKKRKGFRQSISLDPCTLSSPCHFAIVADLDEGSRVATNSSWQFKSYILGGVLFLNNTSQKYQVQWAPERIDIQGYLNEGGRGLELSELIFYDGKLLTFDDRSGIVFEYLRNGKLIPKIILTETKHSTKGMKIEWATVKDNVLWIGSFGKEYIDPQGNIVSYDKFQIALYNKYGVVKHLDWRPVYERLRRKLNLLHPGYLIHEAICWSLYLRKWVILPRRASKEPYNELADEKKGANLLIVASEDFSDIKVLNISSKLYPERGFSSFKFIPGTSDLLIFALKSVEDSLNNFQKSYVTVLETLTGKVLLEDQQVPFLNKYEGLEFIPSELKFPFTFTVPVNNISLELS